MRKILSRVLPVVAVAASATFFAPAAPGYAATSASCPESQSTRLLTGGVGGNEWKLWVYSPTTTQTIVCFDLYDTILLAGGALVVNGGLGFTPPTVVPGSDATACSIEVADFSDPVDFRLALGTAGNVVCFTVNDETVSLTFGLPGVSTLPSVQLWSEPGFTWLDVVMCAPYTDTPAESACKNTEFRQL